MTSILFLCKYISLAGKKREATDLLKESLLPIVNCGKAALILEAAAIFSAAGDYETEKKCLALGHQNFPESEAIVIALRSALRTDAFVSRQT